MNYLNIIYPWQQFVQLSRNDFTQQTWLARFVLQCSRSGFLIRSYGAPNVQEYALWSSIMIRLGPHWQKSIIKENQYLSIGSSSNG